MRFWHFLMMLIVGLGRTQVQAQEIVTIEALSGEIYSIDPPSGASTFLGSTGLNQYTWLSMAKDSHGRLFAAYGYYNVPFVIYEIDLATFHVIPVMQTSFLRIGGMAFDASDNLFLINDRDAPLGAGRDDLWTLDLTTGAQTFIGFTGMTGITALAFGKGALWGYDAGPGGLVRIDPVTGLGLDVNPAVKGTYFLCQTLCFSDDEVLYAGYNDLWIIDTDTAVPSYIGPMPFPGYAFGMEFLPNQLAPFSLGVQGQTGGPVSAFAAGATPGSTVGLFGAIGLGSVSALPNGHPCAGTLLDLNSVHLAMIGRAGPQGRVQFGSMQVPIAARGHVEIQAVDLATCKTSNPVTIFF